MGYAPRSASLRAPALSWVYGTGFAQSQCSDKRACISQTADKSCAAAVGCLRGWQVSVERLPKASNAAEVLGCYDALWASWAITMVRSCKVFMLCMVCMVMIRLAASLGQPRNHAKPVLLQLARMLIDSAGQLLLRFLRTE